mgnify:CR=1 FL=1
MKETHSLADYPLKYEKIHRKGLRVSLEERKRRRAVVARRKNIRKLRKR